MRCEKEEMPLQKLYEEMPLQMLQAVPTRVPLHVPNFNQMILKDK